MTYSKIEILGFRGFSKQQRLSLAIPNGTQPGSGLTILVGPNNSGKSTVTEALRALAHNNAPSFTDGRRNKKAGDKVLLSLLTKDGATKKTIESISAGGSETEIKWSGKKQEIEIFSLSSRRYFSPFFSKSNLTRNAYTSQDPLPSTREMGSEKAAYRLFEVQRNRPGFNALLGEVLSPVPEWTIDQHDQGNYFLKFKMGDATHSSEGMGEGLVSLMLIVDALYDSKPDDTIVIDEPELSLHPALQRKLALVFRRLSKDRQIICSTHSPYFVDLEAFVSHGEIARVHVEQENGSVISQLTNASRDDIRGFLANLNNPHILGLDAREVFFLEDKIVLLEGQEDAVIYPKIASRLGINLSGNFYGWGVGGASNMVVFAQILSELGFKKVFGVLDASKQNELDKLRLKFPNYKFQSISTKDVRDKPEFPAKEAIQGLTYRNGDLKIEYEQDARKLFKDINDYLDV